SLRLSFAASTCCGAPSPAATAALDFIRSAAAADCLDGRGEFGDAALWTFRLPAASPNAPRYAVAGVSASAATFTINFSFLPAATVFHSRWTDDSLEYYAKDGLEIRPSTLTNATKAAVKCAAGGGFLALIESA
ncbi:MAG: hypothetical protein IJP66_05585, partial [Kiritimatiellae bacterium]|nr:hypothetical protein [Kiritimatiellia bacterium]